MIGEGVFAEEFAAFEGEFGEAVGEDDEEGAGVEGGGLGDKGDIGVETEGHVFAVLGELECAGGGNEEAGGVAGVDDFEGAGGGVEHGGEGGDEGAFGEGFGEVEVEVLHDVGEGGVCAHGGVGHHVEAGGDERGGESLAADVGDDDQDVAVFSGDDVNIIAADPFAGGESDGDIEAGDLEVARDEAVLDGVGAAEFAFDGSVGFAEFFPAHVVSACWNCLTARDARASHSAVPHSGEKTT